MSGDDSPEILFERVTYEYRSWALQDVSLAIWRGEAFGIAGHTGSGKSTLAQLAARLIDPSAGKVSSGTRGDIGMVFQYPERQLFAATVFDDVAFGPRNLGMNAHEVESCAHEALQLVHLELDELRDRSPFSLSGGIQRRVAIAGVLAMKPRVLIFDEPAAGLDPRTRNALYELIEELHEQGRTIVLVSHDMDDLARHCDRIAVLNGGRLAMVGPPRLVFADETRLRDMSLDIPEAYRLANWIASTRKAR